MENSSIQERIESYTAQIAKLNHVVINKEDPLMVLISVTGLLVEDLLKAQQDFTEVNKATFDKAIAEYESEFISKTTQLSNVTVIASVQSVLDQIKSFVDNPKTASYKDLEIEVSKMKSEVLSLKQTNKVLVYLQGITCFVLIACSIMYTVNSVFL